MIRACLALVMTIVALQTTAYAADLPDGVKVGDQAPNFNLRNVDGRMVSLAALESQKGAIIVFTCNHCPYSVKYEDRIIALHKKYAPLGYPVIAINPNDTTIVPDDAFTKMQERAKAKDFPFPYVIDVTQQTALAYGARRTPHVFVIAKQKKGFTVEYIGAVDDEPEQADMAREKFVESAVDALLAGKAVAQSFTKAIGCTIKWTKKP
jgi:peroxiredoxin